MYNPGTGDNGILLRGPDCFPLVSANGSPLSPEERAERIARIEAWVLNDLSNHPGPMWLVGAPIWVSDVFSAEKLRLHPSDVRYPQFLRGAKISVHALHERIEGEIRVFLAHHIPADGGQMVDIAAVPTLDAHLKSLEQSLLDSFAFDVHHYGIAEGGDGAWDIKALPRCLGRSGLEYNLCAPNPSRHYGFEDSDWTVDQMLVTGHPRVLSFSRPSPNSSNCSFPFFTLQATSGCRRGGNIAINQSISSAVHSVNSMRWLLQQAYPAEAHPATDTMAFAAVITATFASFYVCWFSEKSNRLHVSNFSQVTLQVEPWSYSVRRCRFIMASILEYGVHFRRPTIAKALDKLSFSVFLWSIEPMPPLFPEGDFGIEELEQRSERLLHELMKEFGA